MGGGMSSSQPMDSGDIPISGNGPKASMYDMDFG
jgi:hypothetical protein